MRAPSQVQPCAWQHEHSAAASHSHGTHCLRQHITQQTVTSQLSSLFSVCIRVALLVAAHAMQCDIRCLLSLKSYCAVWADCHIGSTASGTSPAACCLTVWVVGPPRQLLCVDLSHHQALATLWVIHSRVYPHTEQVLVVGGKNTCRPHHSTPQRHDQS
jgi:hypothetical protein